MKKGSVSMLRETIVTEVELWVGFGGGHCKPVRQRSPRRAAFQAGWLGEELGWCRLQAGLAPEKEIMVCWHGTTVARARVGYEHLRQLQRAAHPRH